MIEHAGELGPSLPVAPQSPRCPTPRGQCEGETVEVKTHYWFWKSRLSERRGQLCKVLCRGKMNSILVEFEDGFRVVTSRFAVRRLERVKNRPAD